MKSIVFTLGCVLSLLVLDARAGIVTLAANRDTGFLQLSGYESSNFGLAEGMGVGSFGGRDNRSVISFDIAPLVGQYSQINSITLRLFVFIEDGPPGSVRTTEVHAISAANAGWTEGSGGDSGGGTLAGDSTWAELHKGTTPWAGSPGLGTAGDDYDPSVLASHTSATVLGAGTPVDFVFTGGSANLTSLINSWSTTNAGLLLLDPALNGGTVRTGWYTRQAVNPAFRPELIVNFSDESSVPEPSTLITLSSLAIVFAAGRWRSSSKNRRR